MIEDEVTPLDAHASPWPPPPPSPLDDAPAELAGFSPTYRPTARMAALVGARNPQCVFPGCTHTAEHCDLDHTVPWPHGRTRVDNLGPLCRHHHRLKTHGRWRLRQLLDGTWEWTSPTDRTYDVRPGHDTGTNVGTDSAPPEPT